MNSEPPIGDDLQRMLVSMKQNVLERAEPRKRRGRRTGIVITVIALLAVGTAGGGVALGLIPTSSTEPEPTPSATSQPSQTVTPSSAPVVGEPTPTPTPTPTAPPYSATDWSTWTISADAVGPATLGSPAGSDDAALRAAFSPAPPLIDDTGTVIYPFGCPNTNSRIWDGPGGERVVEVVAGGTVGTVVIQQGQDAAPGQQVGPKTLEGVGLGSTLAEVRGAYPDLVQTRTDAAGGTRDTFWAVRSGERYIVFQFGEGSDRVATVFVAGTSEPVADYCS
ncbi:MULTISPECIES: hypothetical protein [unclassified Curtobacterium]|uniref:hypothetical protein n=1 Tax=unclassified Curtobacterium TaxID=257496 RepID=UPI000DA866D8|nr:MULTISPECIES: hypothetical protein [unclassified Curtobacterium]PZF30824.1 hypothetical protein DEJ35_07645 [Curtobacterium sp. MCPF17_051]WIB71082.1 hypothetical protein DEI85_01375 [Curtobacterium sp. MCBD17_026]